MPALPLGEAGPYVAAAYLVFLGLILVYVGIMASKLVRIERQTSELVELLAGREREAGEREAGDREAGQREAGARQTGERARGERAGAVATGEPAAEPDGAPADGRRAEPMERA